MTRDLLQAYANKKFAPFALFTRFGIGIFDEKWIEFRIRAFEAITLPSLSAIMRAQDRWYIFIDRDMPLVTRRQLDNAIGRSPAAASISTIPLAFSYELEDQLLDRLYADFKGRPVFLTRVDDDDAFRFDTFKRFSDLAVNYDGLEPLLMTATSAMEFFPVERYVLRGNHTGLINVAYGNLDDLQGYASSGHQSLRTWAEKTSKAYLELDVEHTLFLYNRHRQSSSRFGSRRSYVREHPETRLWRQQDFLDYNLDRDKLMEFRTFAGAAPYVANDSIWSATAEETAPALEHWQQIQRIKIQMLTSRRNITEESDE